MVRGRRFDSGGTALGDEMQINTSTTSEIGRSYVRGAREADPRPRPPLGRALVRPNAQKHGRGES